MRGAEGLADLITHQLHSKDGVLYAPLAESCSSETAEYGIIEIKSSYPWQGRWEIVSGDKPCTIALAAPEWCRDWTIDGE